MIPLVRRSLWLAIGLSASPWLSVSFAETPAQSLVPPPPPVAPVPLMRLPGAAGLRSPVDSFRKLLAMTDAERDKFLLGHLPENRKRLLEKIHEYQAMTADERELVLRATQLRWYLLHFMQAPPVNRLAELAMIPDAVDRGLVEDRLQLWDRLSPTQQKEVLEYETTKHYFVGQSSEAQAKTLQNLPLREREELSRKLKSWQELPANQREQMDARFREFFELTEADKQKTLQVLPEAERQQMDKVLQKFAKLPKEKREKCIQSFTKFASLTDDERQEFLRNAERWDKMSPAERQAWRNLVNRLPDMPPMPPAARVSPMPPPIPIFRRAAVTTTVPLATNDSR
ncbi:MAG: hypothetical protein JWQ71_755 [Pedosphaera sp.]|nr:hypothetical protein [Pedosphaera sp.]